MTVVVILVLTVICLCLAVGVLVAERRELIDDLRSALRAHADRK